MKKNELSPLRLAFESYRLTYIHTYRHTDRQTDTLNIIYHAASRVVNNTIKSWNISTKRRGKLHINELSNDHDRRTINRNIFL